MVGILNQRWRERFLALIRNNEQMADRLIPQNRYWKKGQAFDHILYNFDAVRPSLEIAACHPNYMEYFGFDKWVIDISKIVVNYGIHHFFLNDYAREIHGEGHENVVLNFPLLTQLERIQYLLDLRDFSLKSRPLEGALAKEVSITTQLSYTYKYKKPKKPLRTVFIRTSSRGIKKEKAKAKKIYLNGLTSVFEIRKMRPRDKLYDIKVDTWNKELGNHKLRGNDMIDSMKELLTKIEPHTRKMELWASRRF